VEPERNLRWRIRVLAGASGLGLAGIATGRDPLILAAIALLATGFLLRFLRRE